MSGAASRTYGHQWERDCATLLSATLDLDVRSARSVTGGTQDGADLVTVHDDGQIVHTVEGWHVECKASHNPHQPVPWMRQARLQADSDLYAVLAKNPRKPVGDGTVYLTLRAFRWWCGDGLAVFEHDPTVVWLSVTAWTALLQLDLPTRTTDG